VPIYAGFVLMYVKLVHPNVKGMMQSTARHVPKLAVNARMLASKWLLPFNKH